MNCYCGGPEEAVYGHEYGEGLYCRRRVVGTGEEYYLDLKGARERLCRAQTFASTMDKPVLQRAIDCIDHVVSTAALDEQVTRNM